MRIAVLTNNRFPPREGVARHVLEVATRLQARGHEPIILARGAAFQPWSDSEVQGIKVRHYPHRPVQPFHHALARRELDEWLTAGADGVDLLHVHLPLLPPLTSGLPIVVTFHSPMLQDTRAITETGMKPLLVKLNARLFSRRYEQWYLDRSQAVVAVSSGVAAELAAAYRLHGRSPIVVPNGVDTDQFGFAPANGRQGLLYVGRLGYRKGMCRLLEAFARLRATPRLELTLAGEGPLEPLLRRRAQVLGIAGRVRFAGFLDQAGVRTELQRAAAFVNPADYETGPLTLLEAMACGTPVVTTPTGLAVEMGVGAPLKLAAADPESLAAAISEVLAAPDAAADRARAARALVVASFGWERTVDALERIYGVRRAQAA